MALQYRLGFFACFVIAVAGFWFAPSVFALDAAGLEAMAAVAQLGGPAIAAASCLVATVRSRGDDRLAWFNFGIGSLLYLGGNLGYVYFAVAGITPAFPAAPEAAYFVMALFFAAGMFQYARVRNRLNRVQLYNFVLIYCAVTLGSLFTLGPSLETSVLSPFGTIAAFLYPALWFSVASTGVI
ncbi:MAG: phosphodiesterase, partial [Hyphomicrobiales bacterium]